MNAFSAAVDAIFLDANMAVDAVLLPATPVRVARVAPDDVTNWGDGRFVTPGDLLQLRVSDAPTLVRGDRIVIGAEVLIVTATPRADAERLVWTVEVRAE